MDLGLRGKNAIVTGGTGSLGFAISEVLAEEGCNVIIIHRHDTEERDKMIKELSDRTGVKVKAYVCDLSSEEEVLKLFEKLDEEYDHLDVLVNNAQGGAKRGGIADTDYDDWMSAIDGIVNPVYRMCREFIRRAIEKGIHGNIVNVSAKSAEYAKHKMKIGYTACKGMINAMTKRIADDYCEQGIRVNSIMPGYIWGGFFHGDESVQKAWEAECGLRIGWATPRDLANIVAFLASDCSKQIIGVNLDTSGGTMLG
ncbi:MAG: SDR family oxidoreductase [Erysipelotrichaceae bacterium]|nr:SDR family oxidoreductase [Erysipelotrichaceae bacterium]